MILIENIKIVFPKIKNAKEFAGLLWKLSQTNNKFLVGILINTLTTVKFGGSHTMDEHVIGITNIETRLNTLGMVVNGNFFVQFIFNSLPYKNDQFEKNYSTMKDKWKCVWIAQYVSSRGNKV